MLYLFSEDDFLYVTSLSSRQNDEKSRFDKTFQSMWESSVERNVLKYRLNILSSKTLRGRYSFLAQLNPDRALHRRAPEEIKSLSQPFDTEKFNFTKIRDDEVLFEIKKKGATDPITDIIAVNVSPLEFGHSLLLPDVKNCLPQVLTVRGIQLAIEVLLLSASPALRAGFNSLCGFASVNHLHIHIYYLQHAMLLEQIAVQHLSGPCYELVNYPAQGFVFNLAADHNVLALARSVFKLTNFLQNANVAHNVYMTRGKSLDLQYTESEEILDTVRVYVWARLHSGSVKNREAFDPALCELFGHLVVKYEPAYESLTEQQVVNVLRSVCQEPFQQVRDQVKQLFCDCEFPGI